MTANPQASNWCLDGRACELVSAARRHLRDAETLLAPGEVLRGCLGDASEALPADDAGEAVVEALLAAQESSPEGAFYLAGYAPELIRKATLAERWFDQAIGHVDTLGEDALECALALDPIAHRYACDLKAFKDLRWSTNVRYQAGIIKATQARALIDAARAVVEPIIREMWADGRFPARVRPW